MHLSPINGPFLPHNLISAQGSSVPLLKFQMTPRLKLLISSGSKKKEERKKKKGTHLCIFFFTSSTLKGPIKRTPSKFPIRGPYGESCPFTGPIYISLKFLTTIPLNKKQIFPFLKGPRKGASIHVPPNRGPYGNRRPFPEPYLAYSSGSPVDYPSLQFRLIEFPR